MQDIFKETDDKMKKCLEHVRHEFMTVRTGRASAGLLENVKAECYGAVMPINQLASISVSGARTLEIKPFDKATLQEIEKGILKADLGLTPANDGKVIRLNLPEPTQERRLELVKVIKKMAEDGRVQVRNARRDGIEKIKEREKAKTVSEDDGKKGQAHIQKMTDDTMKKIDEMIMAKEKEVMEI